MSLSLPPCAEETHTLFLCRGPENEWAYGGHAANYSAFHHVLRKVLKLMIGGIPMAGRPLL